MKEISASLLLPVEGGSASFGNIFIGLLRQIGHDLAPQKCGQCEPLKIQCSRMGTEELVSTLWGRSFLWSNTKSKMHGIVEPSSSRTLVVLYGRFNGLVIEEVKTLFGEIARAFPVDFGCIHAFADAEWERYRSDSRRLLDPFNSGVTYHDLATGIPNLGWVTIFGPPYQERLNRAALSRVASAVWTPSDKVASPLFVQLTDDPHEVLQDFDAFDILRSQVREILGKELFKHPGEDAKWVPESLRSPAAVPTAFSDLSALNRQE